MKKSITIADFLNELGTWFPLSQELKDKAEALKKRKTGERKRKERNRQNRRVIT
jgi:hypothetical protein